MGQTKHGEQYCKPLNKGVTQIFYLPSFSARVFNQRNMNKGKDLWCTPYKSTVPRHFDPMFQPYVAVKCGVLMTAVVCLTRLASPPKTLCCSLAIKYKTDKGKARQSTIVFTVFRKPSFGLNYC